MEGQEVGGTRWVLWESGRWAHLGLAGKANQSGSRAQRDKRVVWERPGVCVRRACACVCGVGVGSTKSGLDIFLGDSA